MKKGIFRVVVLLFIGWSLSSAPQVRGDATVYWDFDEGFSPSTTTIGPGETVTWFNLDPFGFDVNIIFDGSISFFLGNLQGQGVVFPAQPGTYSYHSDYGDNGVVIVASPPANISLEAPRLEAGKFLFDVSGLTTGNINVLQTSTNLSDWISLSTNVATSSTMTFTNNLTEAHRFFRVYEIQ